MRIRRLHNEARREGRTFGGDDIKIFEERKFYEGVRVKRAESSDGSV